MDYTLTYTSGITEGPTFSITNQIVKEVNWALQKASKHKKIHNTWYHIENSAAIIKTRSM